MWDCCLGIYLPESTTLLWKVAEETRVELETQGMGLECHEECYPGVAWPVGCFAEEVSARYKKKGISPCVLPRQPPLVGGWRE